jgi:hypothetical protein
MSKKKKTSSKNANAKSTGGSEGRDDRLGPDVVKDLHKATGFSQRLITAAGNAGFEPTQIKSFKDEDALHGAVMRIKPQFLASAGVPTDPRPPKPPVEMVETSSPLTIELSAMRAKNIALRSDDEDRNIEAFMNRTGIRRTLTRMVIDRSYVPEGTKYLTEVTLYYMVPK